MSGVAGVDTIVAADSGVQERAFRGQSGFWGDIQATYQTAWDGEDDDDAAAGKGAAKWY